MANQTTVTRHKFSKTITEENTQLFRLDNGIMSVDICDYGATILSIKAPDKNGKLEDIVLGYGSVAEYQRNGGFFGATVGRYANRIAKGEFTLNGTEYKLAKNDGENHLHGGVIGFDKKLWACEIIENGVCMSIISPDMEEGYPGELLVSVCFTLSADNILRAEYTAKSDKDTVINLTNHSYFNLNGHQSGDILRHELKINAEAFTRVGEGAIPTGELPLVEDTVFDFRESRVIGARLSEENADLHVCGGYDHNFVLSDKKGELREAAVLTAPYTGRYMIVSTDLPGIQLYIGNMIDPVNGKNGAHYGKRSGLCLETQFFPDSPNQTSFPSCQIAANETFNTVTEWHFGIVEQETPEETEKETELN